MPLLIAPLAPPGAAASQDWTYVLSADGQSLGSLATAPLALWPSTEGSEVVAVIPAQALSWHQVNLPKGTLNQRASLRPVLEGLLEDRLLDELSALHFAIAPDARAGSPVWVAVCDKAWLRAALTALEAANHRVTRIVPEFAPDAADGIGSAVAHVFGSQDQPMLAWRGPGGVTCLPLSSAALSLCASQGLNLADDSVTLIAEPAVAAVAEQMLGRKSELLQAGQRWLQAAQGPWDLAQFEFSNSGGQRMAKRAAGVMQTLWQGPQWRAARWGAAVLLVVQLVGLNLWAWRQDHALQERRQEISRLLSQTFPNVKTIVDAPLQMERELALLRGSSGNLSGQDLEAMLGTLGAAAPAAMALTSIDYAAGEARLRVTGGAAAAVSAVAGKLQSQGYSVRAEGDQLVMRAEARP